MIATEADLPLILELCREAHGTALWNELGATFCEESCATSFRFMLDDRDSAIFVTDRGTLWVKRFPMVFNHAQIVTADVFFYATKHGDRLRREAERWAGGLISLSLHGNTDPRADTVFERAGYTRIERRFIKRLP